jgi:hypothetical protein
MLSQRGKRASRNANHMLHIRTHKAQNGHVVQDAYVTVTTEFFGRVIKNPLTEVTAVNGHGDVHLARGDEVDADLV